MKLVAKLTLAFALVTCVVLFVNGIVRVRSEVRAFHDSRTLDHRRIGIALAHGAAAVWRNAGPGAVSAFLRDADEKDDGLEIRQVCEPESASRPDLCAEIEKLPVDVELARLGRDAGGGQRLYTWVKIPTGGVVEVSEPVANELTYARKVLIDSVESAATMVVAFATTAFLLGTWLVGRPTTKLRDVARRIGQGDFSGPVAILSSDELGALATELHATAQQLREATGRAAEESEARIAMLEQLRHADRLLTVGRLASGVAHEMGTPLNVIEVHASMIAGGDVDGQAAREAAAAVVESCERMTQTIRQLLAFARSGALERSPADIGRIARDTVALVAPLAAKSRVALTVEAEDAVANIDAIQIQQALANLVMNAIQALPSGGNVRVSVASSPADHGVQLRVADDGDGIPEEHLGRIFEPFFTTKEVGQGTGLGLSITENIIRDHGGSIAVRSARGGGTTFEVFLPAFAAEAAARGAA
jgi:signal transduction histidine kinase